MRRMIRSFLAATLLAGAVAGPAAASVTVLLPRPSPYPPVEVGQQAQVTVLVNFTKSGLGSKPDITVLPRPLP